eukprot:TRINITY_DN7042_c0_g1_i1.p1 TRINITY_DN7042_c0_g1~~TRINITY_DN7042_c0_g1_i1.p1  ORF type:complete len:347 (+),score=107.38 TRINITY_DN7042_c0_g1_i1:1071-2111(+)
MRYKVLGDPMGREITRNFWREIVLQRSYATGGSNGGNGSWDASLEHWGAPTRLSQTLTDNNQEYCTQYNIMMVSRNLFQWTGDAIYSDHYERAYYNGALGNQYPNTPGVMLYYTPLGNGVTKKKGAWAGWGTPFESFWCCYASGIIQWSKMGDSIYFHQDHVLYVNMYVASDLIWDSLGIGLSQTSDLTRVNSTIQIKIVKSRGEFADIRLRIPYWATGHNSVTVNKKPVVGIPVPGSYLSVPGNWKSDDVIDVHFPMSFHLDAIIDDPHRVAVMYGPMVLVGLTSQNASLRIDGDEMEECFSPVSEFKFRILRKCLEFGEEFEFIPLYQTVDQVYTVYFLNKSGQ